MPCKVLAVSYAMPWGKRAELALVAAIGLGLLYRIIALINHAVLFDGSAYMAMAHAFYLRGEFYMAWGSLWPPGTYTPGYSHWCAPLYPLYLSAFYWAFGYSVVVTKAASFISALMAMIAVYYTTKDLFDRTHALMAVAIVSLNPLLILLTAYNFSENLVIATFTLGLWAMIKGIKNDRYLPMAGAFAALGYLSRSNVGYFFVLAALMGIVWRYRFMGWRFLKNRYYLTAAGIFATVFALWTGRNLYRFGFPNWETNPMITEILAFALNRPIDLTIALFLKALLFMVIILTLATFFIDTFRFRGILQSEELSGYALGVALPVIIAVVFMAAYHVYLAYHGMPKPIFWEEGARYVIIADIPLLWLVFRGYMNGGGEGKEERKEIAEGKETRAGAEKAHIHKKDATHKSMDGSGPPYTKIKPYVFVVVIALAIVAFLYINVLRGLLITVGVIIAGWRLPLKKRIAALMVLLVVSSGFVALHVDRPGYVKAAEHLNPKLSANDTLAVDVGGSIYLLYPYLDRLQTQPQVYHEGCNTTYIITNYIIPEGSPDYRNYTLISPFTSDYGFIGLDTDIFQGVGGEKGVVYLWERR